MARTRAADARTLRIAPPFLIANRKCFRWVSTEGSATPRLYHSARRAGGHSGTLAQTSSPSLDLALLLRRFKLGGQYNGMTTTRTTTTITRSNPGIGRNTLAVAEARVNPTMDRIASRRSARSV